MTRAEIKEMLEEALTQVQEGLASVDSEKFYEVLPELTMAMRRYTEALERCDVQELAFCEMLAELPLSVKREVRNFMEFLVEKTECGR